ncbi:MAG: hypothetical protein ACFFBH_04390 [Promethearchaeota archaeon]
MDNTFEYFDICIIGGSIAGNYLSYLLANSNLKICIIEEHSNIGLPFQCAGIISQKLTNLINIPKNIILNRVKIARIVAPKGKFIRLSGSDNPYIIDRVALDRLFYYKIKDKSNITYFLNEKFKNFEFREEIAQKELFITTDKRLIKAKMIIGCDGPLSRVGKLISVKNKIIYAIQIRISGEFDENEAVLYFHQRWKELFGWIVPEGDNIYRIGLATCSKLKKNFEFYLKKLGLKFEHKLDQQGGIIPFGFMNKLAFNNGFLLGDAAGQVKATTGGGIIMLLKAAKIACNCIKLCFIRNNFSKKFIKKHYEIPCKKSIGRELKIHYLLRLILMRLSNKDFKVFFNIIKRYKIEKLISIYGDMDFPKNIVIKMLRNPFIFLFLFRFLIKNPIILTNSLKLIK